MTSGRKLEAMGSILSWDCFYLVVIPNVFQNFLNGVLAKDVFFLNLTQNILKKILEEGKFKTSGNTGITVFNDFIVL